MHRIINDTINKMIIIIRNEINKSFFFILSSPFLFKRTERRQVLKQFCIPSYMILQQVNYIIKTFLNISKLVIKFLQKYKCILICKIMSNIVVNSIMVFYLILCVFFFLVLNYYILIVYLLIF